MKEMFKSFVSLIKILCSESFWNEYHQMNKDYKKHVGCR